VTVCPIFNIVPSSCKLQMLDLATFWTQYNEWVCCDACELPEPPIDVSNVHTELERECTNETVKNPTVTFFETTSMLVLEV
jgi:hypothetical protein